MAYKNEQVEMYAEEDKYVVFTITDDNGEAMSLSGATGIFDLSTMAGVSKISKTSGITFLDSTATVKLDPADTADLAGLYNYELRIDYGGDSEVVATGVIRIKETKTGA